MNNIANISTARLNSLREAGNKLLVSYGDRYLRERAVEAYLGNNGASHDAYHYWIVKDNEGYVDLAVETNASTEIIGHADDSKVNAESIALLGWTGTARGLEADLKDGIDRVKDTVSYLKDEAEASGREDFTRLAEYLEARVAEAEAYLANEVVEPEGIDKYPPDLVSDMLTALDKADKDQWIDIEWHLEYGPVAWLADAYEYEAPVSYENLDDAMSGMDCHMIVEAARNARQWTPEGTIAEVPFDPDSEWFIVEQDDLVLYGLHNEDFGAYLKESMICHSQAYLEWLARVSNGDFCELARMLDL